MKIGDLVKVIGSHGEGPEVTAVIGVIMKPWKVDKWWVVMMPHRGLIHWPESQMMKVDN